MTCCPPDANCCRNSKLGGPDIAPVRNNLGVPTKPAKDWTKEILFSSPVQGYK